MGSYSPVSVANAVIWREIMRHNSAVAFLIAFAFLVEAKNVFASAIAFDSAGDSAYNAGSYLLINGGYGWGGPWGGTYLNGRQNLVSSSTNGDGDPSGTGDINSPRS